MSRPSDVRRGLALGEMASRIDALERRAVAAEARERELREHVDSLSRSLAKAWRRIEALDRPGVRIAAPQMPALAQRQLERVPAVAAARRLGIAPASVRRLVASGDLVGLALQLPDRARKVWVVELASLERFERDGGSVGAADTEKQARAGLLGQRKGG